MGNTKLLSVFLFFYFLKTFGVISVQPSRFFNKNCMEALSNLASNVSEDQNRYSDLSVGQGLNRVYALGMCTPGTERDTCRRCIMSGSRNITRKCSKEPKAFLYVPLQNTYCLVRYSNRSFGSTDLFPVETKTEISQNLPSNSNSSSEFILAWQALMICAMNKASLVVHERLSRADYFAIDARPFRDGLIMYAFMLCSKDMSPLQCADCLRKSINDFNATYPGKPGRIQRPSCFMRWDMSPFDGLAFNTTFESSELTKKGGGGRPLSNKSIGAIVVITFVVVTAVIALGFVVCKRRKAYQAFPNINEANDDSYSGSLQFEFRAIEVATNNFHESNKLGQGGFGEVYKGKFPNGTEVAVKRLSKSSGQGEQEFKNEVLLVAKLQHKNLVRLLGFSVQGEEKILVYEFVPNKSLDYFLFDSLKRGQLDWAKRYNIIGGITRGILYLHQDSRLTIIHRDLKASNILLDDNMNPKIADFGMARNFTVDQTEANTKRVVGTFGYMPPEYAANGQFSMKSDVYSFGVLILEIICGKMNSRFHKIDGSRGNLVTHVWRLWNNESLLELVDPTIGENYDKDEVIRCIHIGLLCVQENPTDRPTMSTVFQMLTNTSITLPVPQPPGFFFKEKSEPKDKSEPKPSTETLLPGPSTSHKSSVSFTCSVDEEQITMVTPR